jgi:cytochrome c biogenesis protein CcmG, thiol:disulfide interchange protein DsbE
VLGSPEHEGQDHRRVGRLTTTGVRSVALVVLAVIAVTVTLAGCAALGPAASGGGGSGEVKRGQPAPAVDGTTLDGQHASLSELRGKPVIVNFWGPSCVPCRNEFPLFKEKLAEHAGDGLTILGVLMDDPPEDARDFVADLGATWPTVVDPDESIVGAYRVAARPQSYFVDPDGILRSIQIGELVASDFERQYALIAPRS